MSKRVVIVTGGARGMGSSMVRQLVEAGFQVAITDLLDAEGEALAKELGDSASYHHLNVTDVTGWSVVVAELMAVHRNIFGLVNNAGVPLRHGLMATTDDEWRFVMSVNVDGCFYAMRAVAPAMRDSGGGSIVNISSIAGLIGYHATGYATSKWALRGMSKSAAIEFAPWNIRVNSVHPGLVDTPLMQQANPVFIEETLRATPASRPATGDDIAAAVTFLMSDGSQNMTGSEMTIDGGLSSAGTYWQITNNVAARS
jgi:3alpha(or 20beta)-hydroxysteroid dehydrogenase